jgi:thiazole synthase
MDLKIGDVTLTSRLFVGSALYPSPAIMQESIRASGAQVVTVSLKRQAPASQGGQFFWNIIKDLGCRVLPNTAGCRLANDAVNVAEMSREIFGTSWIKLEVIGDDYTLQPHPFELVKAAEELVKRGFTVFPYCTEDLILCQKLRDLGCPVLMPWCAPIGSGQGLLNIFTLKTLRARIPELPLIIDAGIGRPSHAVQALELGFDGVLINSALALAHDPVGMARAFAQGVEAGRQAFLAGPMEPKNMAHSSTPLLETPFWMEGES